MAYLLVLLFFYQYLRLSTKGGKTIFSQPLYMRSIVWLSPIVIVWCLLIGGQYNVGSDYFTYLRMFEGSNLLYILSRGDVGFATLVSLCNEAGFYGQSIFFVLSFFWVIILLYFGQNFVDKKQLFLFIFIFIVFSSTFNNQMNAVRQYCAVYLYTLSICFIFKKYWVRAGFCLFLMTTMHSSSVAVLLLFPLLIIVGNKIRARKWLLIIVIISVFFSIAFPEDLFTNIIGYFPQYVGYIEGDSMAIGGTDTLTKLTKYINLPLVFYAIFLFPRMNLSEDQKRLFVIGICGYAIKLSLMDVSIMQRMGAYFEILMCLPITYLMIFHLYKNRKLFPFLFLYLLLPYAAKVTFLATREYTYSSIFLQ